ncbi:MAG: hypothetical protein ACPGVO_16240 [Spirulinaceae cyanobacterium]
MTPEQHQDILDLRSKKLTPKQIARKLGLKVSQVKSFLQDQAEETAIARAEGGLLDPVVDCYVNRHTAQYLLNASENRDQRHGSGLGQVMVVRSPSYGRYLSGGLLVFGGQKCHAPP